MISFSVSGSLRLELEQVDSTDSYSQRLTARRCTTRPDVAADQRADQPAAYVVQPHAHCPLRDEVRD